MPMGNIYLSIGDTADALSDAASGVSQISKALNDYGPVIVISGVFILIFIGLALLILRTNAKLLDHIIEKNKTSEESNESIVSKLVQTALDNYTSSVKLTPPNIINDPAINNTLKSLEKSIEEIRDIENRRDNNDDCQEDYHKDLVGAYIDVNMSLKDATRVALNDIGCDRIAIYVFHNGNNSIHGLPFFKLSCIHEWTHKGIKTLRGKYHIDIPLHIFNDFIESLYSNGYYKTNDLELSLEQDPSLKEFTAYSNAQALYMVGIYDADIKLVGFVIAEFENKDTFDTDVERDMYVGDALRTMCQKISPIVAERYVYKHNK